jgi:hypothetical protein
MATGRATAQHGPRQWNQGRQNRNRSDGGAMVAGWPISGDLLIAFQRVLDGRLRVLEI